MTHQRTQLDPSRILAVDCAMRAIANVPKLEVGWVWDKELKRKPMASTRKRKGK